MGETEHDDTPVITAVDESGHPSVRSGQGHKDPRRPEGSADISRQKARQVTPIESAFSAAHGRAAFPNRLLIFAREG
jgi:hypothetical protein